MCPFCGSRWVRFAKKRGTYKCHSCGILDATGGELARWYNPWLPLNAKELEQAYTAYSPTRSLTRRLLSDDKGWYYHASPRVSDLPARAQPELSGSISRASRWAKRAA